MKPGNLKRAIEIARTIGALQTQLDRIDAVKLPDLDAIFGDGALELGDQAQLDGFKLALRQRLQDRIRVLEAEVLGL